jgi:hypothetical protein
MAAKCKICNKSVYQMDPQINLDGCHFHKPCAKCADCQCQISLSNFVKNDGGESGEFLLLCKIHHLKRFHEQGSYIGADKFRVKAERDIHALNKPQAEVRSVISTATDDDNVSVSTAPLSEEEQKIKPGAVKAQLAMRRKSQIDSEAAAIKLPNVTASKQAE